MEIGAVGAEEKSGFLSPPAQFPSQDPRGPRRRASPQPGRRREVDLLAFATRGERNSCGRGRDDEHGESGSHRRTLAYDRRREGRGHGDRRAQGLQRPCIQLGGRDWLNRLPTLWIEGEVTELRRQQRWASVFFTLKDPEDGACLPAQMPRGQFDALELDLREGERVHVFGRAELYEQRGELKLKVLTIERFGLGAHLAALERLKRKLAAEGLFAAERKRPLPRFPRLIGLVTGNDAAAKQDVLTHIVQRFPPANVLVAETYVQGPRAPAAIATAIGDLCKRGADVIVLARGGGSFEDLLPFSDERRRPRRRRMQRAVVSAVGHEQDTPLCDLAADVRASTPTAAARLVVPDITELRETLVRSREALAARRARAPRSARAAARARRTSGCGARRCSRWSAAARRSTRCTRGCARSQPRRDARARVRDRAPRRRARPRRDAGRARRLDRRATSPTAASERPLAEPTFEEAQRELEAIVTRLERGDAGVDELTKLWERGEELYRICATKLEVVQGKIEELRALEERPA